ncbi:hypothetical protein BUALT_Bualt08G0072400 [Buddleja alternifolia]|uniref:CBS domain-containing protein n=1 Tax=Buddleja alternifolia TaxID=168488 RepID=A0AAV6X8F2_9LAMI|nr:hypothetical protein BUALT_Bualt08G0072400 [Buddleja alternifolia]
MMQGLLRAYKCCYEHVHIKKLLHSHSISSPTKHHKGVNDPTVAKSHTISEKGLQNLTVAEVLMTKGEEKVGSWLSCHTNDTVYDAVKQMAQNNIGSLVVLKPGEQQLIAGIFTERENHMRHAPVIDGKIVGMISIVDVVRTVLEQQHGEVKRLSDFIQGDYF